MKNKELTRITKEHFSHIEESQKAMERFVYEKIKKGYSQKNIHKER